MKKPMLSAISKFTLGIVMISTLSAAQAQTSPASLSENKAEVKYLGNAADAVLFKLSYDNPSGDRFIVTVMDEEGTRLFQGAYTDKRFDKRFQLPKLDISKLTFVIRNFKDFEWKETFKINTRVVEDVVVTKI